MKRLLAVFALCCITSLLIAQPRLQVEDGATFDFGTIVRGRIVDRKVVIKNTGKEMLVIQRVQATCGCTGTLLSKKEIPPGEAGTVQITFNSHNFTGPIHKRVIVLSNSVDSASTFIDFTANVIEIITVNPAQVWFRDARVGKTSSAKISVANVSKSPVTLTGYASELAGFSFDLPASPINPGAVVEVTANFKPEKSVKYLSDKVVLRTSSKDQPEMELSIFGDVQDFNFGDTH